MILVVPLGLFFFSLGMVFLFSWFVFLFSWFVFHFPWFVFLFILMNLGKLLCQIVCILFLGFSCPVLFGILMVLVLMGVVMFSFY